MATSAHPLNVSCGPHPTAPVPLAHVPQLLPVTYVHCNLSILKGAKKVVTFDHLKDTLFAGKTLRKFDLQLEHAHVEGLQHGVGVVVIVITSLQSPNPGRKSK